MEGQANHLAEWEVLGDWQLLAPVFSGLPQQMRHLVCLCLQCLSTKFMGEPSALP